MNNFPFMARLSLALLITILVGSVRHVSAKQASNGLPRGFVYLRDVAPTILQDMRYASANNFTGKQLPGYQAAQCILRSDIAKALSRVQQHIKSQGLKLKVYDCYRPKRAVHAFSRWARDHNERSTKHYYPRIAKDSLFVKGYIAQRSGHSKGSTVDLTVVRPATLMLRKRDPQQKAGNCTAPQNQRAFDSSIDMGTAFDCFDVMSHTDHPAIQGQARRNRQNLRAIMTRFGFANYRKEWWHYSYKKRPYPRTYHDFVIRPRPAHN